jgi:hypothetical protein
MTGTFSFPDPPPYGPQEIEMLLVSQSAVWFRDKGPYTIPVRDVAVLFIPWHRRVEPVVDQMLRFMHVEYDLGEWNHCISYSGRRRLVQKNMVYGDGYNHPRRAVLHHSSYTRL